MKYTPHEYQQFCIDYLVFVPDSKPAVDAMMAAISGEGLT